MELKEPISSLTQDSFLLWKRHSNKNVISEYESIRKLLTDPVLENDTVYSTVGDSKLIIEKFGSKFLLQIVTGVINAKVDYYMCTLSELLSFLPNIELFV